jgi:hypothetical protein
LAGAFQVTLLPVGEPKQAASIVSRTDFAAIFYGGLFFQCAFYA